VNSASTGEPAPQLELSEAYGGQIVLHELLRSRIVVLAFYPSPFGMMCAVEMRQLKSMYEEFRAAGAEILGIATNSVPVMSAFKERIDLPFPQLADPDGRASATFGVLIGKEGYLEGRCNRAVIIVDRDGTIRYRWIARDPAQGEEPDYDEMLAVCREIAGDLTPPSARSDSTR
jgi:peroxiredoxin Q/BCP